MIVVPAPKAGPRGGLTAKHDVLDAKNTPAAKTQGWHRWKKNKTIKAISISF